MILLIRLPVAEYCDWTFGGNPPRRGRGVPKKCTNPSVARVCVLFIASGNIFLRATWRMKINPSGCSEIPTNHLE